MSKIHDDILKKIAKRIALLFDDQQKKPMIHINVNFDKYCQLFEHEADWQQASTQKGALEEFVPSFLINS